MSKIAKITVIVVFVGIASGLLSSSFLHSLAWVTAFRQDNPLLIWGLPVFGFIFGLIIRRIPHHINEGVPYILMELDNQEARVSPWMAPFIFLSSLGTHLFGGSAGREGVGVIMGASAAHLIPRFKHSYIEMRPYLIYAGMAAGFSSIFGTPFAAVFFAFELHAFKDIKKKSLFICTMLASFAGFVVSHFLGPSHQRFHVTFSYSTEIIFYVVIAGISSGAGAHLFYWGLKAYTQLISKIFPSVEWKLFTGGLLISGLVFFTNSYDYAGIGTDVIAQSFISQMEPYDFIMKCLLTIMTLSIGFKGGEVTPLFFMGATLSNGIAHLLNFKNYSLSSSLGMVGLFGAVTGTPLASGIMGVELFGWEAGALSLVCCFLSRKLMGHYSVYRH